ncbi:MAG: DUF58 domain-containing protein [Bacillaceae bacterium]|nr:DUF58 domain-containing protein [Bacillaceae bacterium]
MQQIDSSCPPFLETRLWPSYFGVLIIVVWFPFVWPLAYVCSSLLAIIFVREQLKKRLPKLLRLTFRQKEQLLFVNDAVHYQLGVDNIEVLNDYGISASLRFKAQSGLIFEDKNAALTIPIASDKHSYPVPVHAIKRGPTGLEECVLSIHLPLFLGTIFVVYSKDILPQWTVLPPIRKEKVVQSRAHRIGDRLVKHSPLKDPLMIQGSKRYEAEPVKQIDWYSTAKTGKMQSKVFQRQNIDTFTLVLDLSTPQGNGLHAHFEELIQQTSYLISHLLKEECKIELFINRLDQENQVDHLLMSEGKRQLRYSLIRLAMIHENDKFIASNRFQTIVQRRKHPQSELVKINHSFLFNT